MDAEEINQITAKGKEEFCRGKTLKQQRRLDEAIQWYYKTRETMNKIFIDNSFQNRNLMRNLGVCLFELGRVDDAYPFLKIYIKLTKITRKKINKLKLGQAYFYAGVHCSNKDWMSKAKNKWIKCEKIFEEVLPSNHPFLAIIYNNLAILYSNEGKFEESLKYYLKCKQVREEILPF